MNYTDFESISAMLNEAVLKGDVTIVEAVEAIRRHKDTGRLVVKTTCDEGIRYIGVNPESLFCDCGKGLYCPLNIQIVEEKDSPVLVAVCSQELGKAIGPFVSEVDARLWMVMNDVVGAIWFMETP